jgi:hypothetical protein
VRRERRWASAGETPDREHIFTFSVGVRSSTISTLRQLQLGLRRYFQETAAFRWFVV